MPRMRTSLSNSDTHSDTAVSILPVIVVVSAGHSMPLSDTSHSSCSPSLTSLVDSAKLFSLPSPKGDDPIVELPQFKSKFPSNHSCLNQVSIRKMSALDTLTCPCYLSTSLPDSPSNNISNNQDIPLESHSPRSLMQQYHPYIPRERGIIPPALHYTMQSLRIMTSTDVMLEEVEEVHTVTSKIESMF